MHGDLEVGDQSAHQGTATVITSGGNRNPANLDLALVHEQNDDASAELAQAGHPPMASPFEADNKW